MVRAMSFLLSFWLAALFVVGQGAHVPQLLVACVGLFALFALFGAVVSPTLGLGWRLTGTIALSLGLFAVWLVALLMHSAPWFPWCIFMGVVPFLGVALAELVWAPRNRGTMAPADS